MTNPFIPMLQYGSIIITCVIAILCATRWRAHPWYGWMLLAFMLGIPFEWFADEYWSFVYYKSVFIPMFRDFPLLMPFAWGWFFWLPLVIMLSYRDKIAKLPLLVNFIWMFALFFIQDFIVEGFFTSELAGRLWVYYGYPSSMMATATLPWYIPLWMGLSLPIYYIANLWALRRVNNNNATGWLQGALIFLGANYAAGIIIAVMGYIVSAHLLGLPLEPRPPMAARF